MLVRKIIKANEAERMEKKAERNFISIYIFLQK